jgi:ClpP class serine protease
MAASNTSNQVVQAHLSLHLAELEKRFGCDVLSYVGPIAYRIDQAIREAIEQLPNKKDKLLVILESDGGFAETARRISDIMRHHYKVVEFLVPSHAMSAATILVMSGDAIHMDYSSVLGPIDPQVEDADGSLVPALGYLIQYEKLLRKANQGKISTAEMRLLLAFDQTRLYAYEQARDLSRSLLQEWLVKYKFKDWKVTEGRSLPVTEAMKRKRAKQIADKLNDVRLWNSHGIGISMERLRQSDLNLKIDDFGKDAATARDVRLYHSLLTDFMARMSHRGMIHTRGGYEPLMVER